jgi:ATP-binding cassette subfamily F protein uup
LSGGERARLLLAKLIAKPSNLLVLDEYDGTVLLVSHDRDFLDRVAATTVAMEGRGRVSVHAGGWSDYEPKRDWGREEAAPVAKKGTGGREATSKKRANGLSFTEKHRLEALPKEIARLEAEIGKLEGFLADADLYTREPVKFAKASEALAERQAKLAAAEDEWLALAEKAED